MDKIAEFMNTDSYLFGISVSLIIMFFIIIFLLVKVIKLNSKYKKFIEKLSNGKNIEEDLENYLHRVDRVEKQNGEIFENIKLLDDNLKLCIQKVGMVSYNAFDDAGKGLSFALALLNDKNDGVILNGIYSREMSNIYAKKIENGESTKTLSKEEKEAIKKAISENNNL